MAGHREGPPVTINVDVKGFDKIIDRLQTSLSTIDAIADAMRDVGRIAQRRAVANVSGVYRVFNGKPFVVNRVTGKLARSIQMTMPNPLALVIEATADYASDVELGTRGPTDLKKTKLAGKIIPMPLTQAQGKAIQSAKGALTHILVGTDRRLNKMDNSASTGKTTTSGFKANKKVATTGKKMGTSFILFRRVPSRGGKGWIIPQRPARPFMEEAGNFAAPLLKEAVEAAYKSFLEEGD